MDAGPPNASQVFDHGDVRIASDSDRTRQVTIDDLEPAWLTERVAQYRRAHGAWWWRRPALVTLFFVGLFLVLIGVSGYLIHIARGAQVAAVAASAFAMIAIVFVAVMSLTEDSQRRAGEAMLARIRMQTNAPVLPLRKEYEPSRFPANTSPAPARKRAGLPNLWIPMRHVDSFRFLHATCPYKQVAVRLCRHSKYAPVWIGVLLDRLYNPAGTLAALALFETLVLLQAPSLALGLMGLAAVLALIVSRFHQRFSGSVYAERIKEDWPCLVCGYPLKSLHHTEGTIARCPECGSSLTTLDICLSGAFEPSHEAATLAATTGSDEEN